MILDLIQATQDAFFASLNTGVDPALAPVRQHVKQDMQPPFIKVGAIDSDNEAGKGEQLERLRVEIQCVFRGQEKGPLLDLMHAVRLALDPESGTAVPLAAEGVDFGSLRFVTSTAGDASPIDGLTYAGITIFEVFAEPA